jgi:folylpolyglutamate synthase/dihydropteroate synthase
LILILAFMADKDIEEILKELTGFAQVVILTQTKSARAMSVTALENQVRNISGFADRIEVSDNSDEALKKSMQVASELGNSAGIIALGSVVLAGEIASILKVGKNK